MTNVIKATQSDPVSDDPTNLPVRAPSTCRHASQGKELKNEGLGRT